MATAEQYKRIIAQNKKAYHDYFIEEKLEAGIVLTGSEVKSLRAGKANINDSHAAESKGEIFLFNSHVAEYEKANRFNHETRRARKLLLHKQQIRKLIGKLKVKGYTLVALTIYFNDKNRVKVELGLAKGKKEYDKRQTIKEKEWKRDQERIMKNYK
ncbi:MAG: smpB [Rickettsiaceae bacterium]|jgi:SsrA-binding protein|nr:smpB [Rickettsiaceae bacterium]